MMQIADELSLLADADRRSAKYLSTVGDMRVFPDQASLAALNGFDEGLPQAGHGAEQTLDMLDRLGSPATVASNGPRYFGFVIGASLPAAAAAERLAMAWDQCASSFDNSPAAATIEAVAGKWITEILDLPREAAIQKLIVALIRDGLVDSAHDCSEGGLAIALAECTFDSGGIGVTADLAPSGDTAGSGDKPSGVSTVWRVNATLFGESASRIVVSVAGDRPDAVLAAANAAGVTATAIGKTGGDRIRLSVGGNAVVDSAISDAEQAWTTAIERRMSANVR